MLKLKNIAAQRFLGTLFFRDVEIQNTFPRNVFWRLCSSDVLFSKELCVSWKTWWEPPIFL